MGLPVALVDAFTDRPFAGNPAAICLLDGPADDEWLQAVAAEANQPETAFLEPVGTNGDRTTWRLRWFSPVCEVELCGHATLAAAHHLLTDVGIEATSLDFVTLSGTLTAKALPDGWIQLDFPADPPVEAAAPEGLLDALGLDSVLSVARGRSDWLVEVPTADDVRAVQPCPSRLAAVPEVSRGVIVTAVGDRLHDFVSRFFAPAVGIPEDHVTGSAHTTLAPFWAERLSSTDFLAQQASPRGGVLKVALRDDRVLLSGQAVTLVRGHFEDDLLEALCSRRAATPT